jgi:hypothetical protein
MRKRNAESRARRRAGEQLEGRRRRRTVQSVLPYKTCPRCKNTYELERFVVNRTQPRDVGGYCLPCHNEVVRSNAIKNHGSTRSKHLKARYGLTSEEVAAMIEAQGGLCAICRRKAAEHVDHDHYTGEVRGILCFTCNVGLGNFGDDPDLMMLASDYLLFDDNGEVREHLRYQGMAV